MSFIQLFALSPAEVAEGPASLKEKRNMEERQQKEDSGVVGRSRQQAPLQDEGVLVQGRQAGALPVQSWATECPGELPPTPACLLLLALPRQSSLA